MADWLSNSQHVIEIILDFMIIVLVISVLGKVRGIGKEFARECTKWAFSGKPWKLFFAPDCLPDLSVEVTDRDDLEVLAAAVTAFFSDALVTPYFRQADNTGASEYFQRRRFTPRSPRRPAMTTSREYREFARECTKWAADAASAESRNSLLHLAADWIIASVITDRRELVPTFIEA